ncbi:MAG: N-acetylmuramoyl-L-alanine amidase family protein [Chitinophagales bacterium]
MLKNNLLLLGFLLLWLSASFSHENSYYRYTINRVVIDAGHGGKDNGCSGKHTKEKGITLAIALKLGKYIEENIPNVKVIYTRKKDFFVELHERAALANRNNADLFISVHCNASSPSAYGTETYVMGVDKSRENLDVARRENAVVLLENDYKEKYDGFDLDNPENEIIFSLYQNAYLDQSIQLAAFIEDQFKTRAKRHSRGVRQESFLVLYKTAMPSVLVETGFLTNGKEEKYLKSEAGQTYVASAIFRAFKEYKETLEGGGKRAKQSQSNNYKNPNPAGDAINYQVQLYDAYESVNLGKPNFAAVASQIEIEINDKGIKHYMLDKKITDYDHAIMELMRVQKLGFQFARIIIYENGKRIE